MTCTSLSPILTEFSTQTMDAFATALGGYHTTVAEDPTAEDRIRTVFQDRITQITIDTFVKCTNVQFPCNLALWLCRDTDILPITGRALSALSEMSTKDKPVEEGFRQTIAEELAGRINIFITNGLQSVLLSSAALLGLSFPCVASNNYLARGVGEPIRLRQLNPLQEAVILGHSSRRS
ncbi:MAG: hypothetical protein JSR76_01860 [Verrucomicrobia bacterium]|nr:hypothetical protein [Verrucomicrobiota bacterium]